MSATRRVSRSTASSRLSAETTPSGPGAHGDDLEPFRRQLVGLHPDRRVLERRDDEATALRGGRPHHGVVRLGAGAREEDLRSLGSEQIGDLTARALDGRPRGLPYRVDRRRVAVQGTQVRQHGFDDTRIRRTRRVVVEVGALMRSTL